MKRRKQSRSPAAIMAAGALLLAFVLDLSAVRLHAAEIGFNRVNLAWQKAPERKAILASMKQNGVKSVRLSLSAPVDESLDAVRTAHQMGLRVLLEISLSNHDFYPKGTERRSAKGKSFNAYRLSDLDPEGYRVVLKRALAKLDRMGIALIAIEPGNEINWAGYNGDLAVGDDPAAAASPAVEQGVERYVDILEVTRQEMAATKLNRDAKLVSAGLSDMPVSFSRNVGLEIIPAPEWTRRMQAHGLDTFVDAYGIHIYPGSTGTDTERAALVRDALAFCEPASSGKPCWVTEWGVANVSPACPIDDKRRADQVDQVRAIIDGDIRSGSVKAAYYFDWDSKTPYSVWRCGGLSSAGRAALRPILP